MTIALDPNATIQNEILAKEGTEDIAIVGTREPDEAQSLIAYQLAFAIAVLGGKVVRTGAANGVDHRAMLGTGGTNLKVFLPWDSFHRSIIPNTASVEVYKPFVHKEWRESVSKYHPNTSLLPYSAFCLHARNFGIVSGCKAVIALPRPDGGGGTSQAIRIARALGIPILQANKGTVTDAPRWIGRALQILGFASKDLKVTLGGNSNV